MVEAMEEAPRFRTGRHFHHPDLIRQTLVQMVRDNLVQLRTPHQDRTMGEPTHVTRLSLSNTAQQQQQQQQALVGALGLGDSMNDLASFALSGDLAKAIQLANVGLLQGGAPDNGLGSAASMYQQLQLQQLQQLELQRSQPTMHQQGSSAKASIANPYEQTALENTSDQHSMAGGSARSASRYAVRSANSVQPTEKEDNAKRTLVVPCRARGMTMEHNFQVRFKRQSLQYQVLPSYYYPIHDLTKYQFSSFFL